MNKKNMRATSNLKMLEFVARKLEDLNDQVVYLGGCTTALFITDPLSLDVRTTKDVDCIVDVASLGHYHQFENKLMAKGFKRSMEDDVNCRWHYDEMILDVMPTDKKILHLENLWFKEAMLDVWNYEITDDLIIKSITAPYFLATKIEAFRTRGNNDFWASHDFEDIVTVIAGRIEVAEEVALMNANLKTYLKLAFEEILKNPQFERVLPSHVEDGAITLQRVQVVKDRIAKIIKNGE